MIKGISKPLKQKIQKRLRCFVLGRKLPRSPSTRWLELISFEVGEESCSFQGGLCFEVSPPPAKKVTKKPNQISTPSIINLKRNPPNKKWGTSISNKKIHHFLGGLFSFFSFFFFATLPKTTLQRIPLGPLVELIGFPMPRCHVIHSDSKCVTGCMLPLRKRSLPGRPAGRRVESVTMTNPGKT